MLEPLVSIVIMGLLIFGNLLNLVGFASQGGKDDHSEESRDLTIVSTEEARQQ